MTVTIATRKSRDRNLRQYRASLADHTRSHDIVGHVTIWSPICHSYRCCIVSESLSPAIFEILGPNTC